MVPIAERYDPVSTGPNLMPWCEMVYFHQFGDTERLHKIFPVLCAYYKWLKLNHTWRNGTYWSSGWGPAWIICPVFRRNTALSTVTGI